MSAQPMPAQPLPPPVVAVVVTRDPGDWLEEALAALGAQDYPNLSVLVIDDASAEDPTARVAGVLPSAYIRRLPEPVGVAAAANEVLGVVEGASHFVFCHDDVAPEPEAIRLLVEEAYRSNAGVVAPKLVAWDDPRRLLQVGMGVDKSGAPAQLCERGELDQEQHDAVRDVFFAPGGAILVRADLFAALGGFDPVLRAFGEDLDLSWRAQVAGARVVVAPASRVRHLEAMAAGRRAVPEDALATGADGDTRSDAAPADLTGRDVIRRLQLRHRLRTVLTCYSRPSLLLILPQLFVLAVAEVAYGLLAGRRATSSAIVEAWRWNLGHIGEVRRARRRVQALRRLPDREIRRLQARGSARFSAFVRGQLAGEDRLNLLAAGREVAGSFQGRSLRLGLSVWVPLVLVLTFGVRDLITNGVPAVHQMLPIDRPGDLLHQAVSGWRLAGLGSERPAPTAFALLGSAGVALFGATGLLRTLLVIGCIPIGIAGAYRFARPIGGVRARLAAAVLYAINPLPWDALHAGRWRTLIAYAAVPFLLAPLARATGLRPFAVGASPRMLAHLAPLAIGLAVLTALVPAAPVLVLLPALGLLLGAAAGGGAARTARALGVAVGGSLGALVLLFPWSLDLVLPGASWSAIVGAPRPSPAALADLVRFDLGPAGGGPSGWALLLAASLGLAIGRGWRLAWAARLWGVALVSWGLAWVVARGWSPVDLPPVDLLLVPAAAALAAGAALGVAAFEVDLPAYRFGWRQGAASTALLAAGVAALPIAAGSLDGAWGLPARDLSSALSWMDERSEEGSFRTLWLGDPSLLPLEGWELERGVAWGLTRDGTPTAADLWPGSPVGPTGLVEDALDVARAGDTTRLGQLLAPMAIRYIVIVHRAAPEQERSTRRPVPARLERALRAQVDLRAVDTDPAVTVYENDRWAPIRADLPAEAEVPSRLTGLASASLADLAPAGPVLSDRRSPTRFSGQVPAGEVLLSEARSGRWRLEVGGEAADLRPAFGWAAAYDTGEGGTATLRYRTSPVRWILLAAQALLWAGAVALVRRERRDRRSRAEAGALLEPDEAQLVATAPPPLRRDRTHAGAVVDDDPFDSLGDEIGDVAAGEAHVPEDLHAAEAAGEGGAPEPVATAATAEPVTAPAAAGDVVADDPPSAGRGEGSDVAAGEPVAPAGGDAGGEPGGADVAEGAAQGWDDDDWLVTDERAPHELPDEDPEPGGDAPGGPRGGPARGGGR